MSKKPVPQHDFWKLTHSESPRIRDTAGWERGEEDAYNRFWSTAMSVQKFDGKYPNGFRIWVEEGNSPIADYPAIGLPMIIFSDRLLNCLLPLIGDDIEAFPAPLFEKKSLAPVEGFHFVHVRTKIDCIDASNSSPWYLDNLKQELVGYSTPTIFREKVRANIFKYSINGRASAEVIVSRRFLEVINGGKFTGIGFTKVAYH